MVKKSNNFTYYGKSEIGNYLELNGINYQCPASFTGTCTALYEFDRNGTILSMIYASQSNQPSYYCSQSLIDVTVDGYLEFSVGNSYGCTYRLGDDTLLFSTSASGYVIFDNNFSHVMDIAMQL